MYTERLSINSHLITLIIKYKVTQKERFINCNLSYRLGLYHKIKKRKLQHTILYQIIIIIIWQSLTGQANTNQFQNPSEDREERESVQSQRCCLICKNKFTMRKIEYALDKWIFVLSHYYILCKNILCVFVKTTLMTCQQIYPT